MLDVFFGEHPLLRASVSRMRRDTDSRPNPLVHLFFREEKQSAWSSSSSAGSIVYLLDRFLDGIGDSRSSNATNCCPGLCPF